MVVAKDAPGRRVEIQPSAFAGCQADPPSGHDPEHVAVPEEENVPGTTADSIDQAVGARSDVGHGFAVRATVIEQIPRRAFGANLGRPSTFVLAVIPLDQICIDRGD